MLMRPHVLFTSSGLLLQWSLCCSWLCEIVHRLLCLVGNCSAGEKEEDEEDEDEDVDMACDMDDDDGAEAAEALYDLADGDEDSESADDEHEHMTWTASRCCWATYHYTSGLEADAAFCMPVQLGVVFVAMVRQVCVWCCFLVYWVHTLALLSHRSIFIITRVSACHTGCYCWHSYTWRDILVIFTSTWKCFTKKRSIFTRKMEFNWIILFYHFFVIIRTPVSSSLNFIAVCSTAVIYSK